MFQINFEKFIVVKVILSESEEGGIAKFFNIHVILEKYLNKGLKNTLRHCVYHCFLLLLLTLINDHLKCIHDPFIAALLAKFRFFWFSFSRWWVVRIPAKYIIKHIPTINLRYMLRKSFILNRVNRLYETKTTQS